MSAKKAEHKISGGLFYDGYSAAKDRKEQEEYVRKKISLPEDKDIVIKKVTWLETLFKYSLRTIKTIAVIIIFVLAVIGAASVWAMCVNENFRKLAFEIANFSI